MVALATTQLDIFFGDRELPPFEKLLIAVLAEHVLLATKLVISYAGLYLYLYIEARWMVGRCMQPHQLVISHADGRPSPSEAAEAAEQYRRSFLRGVHGYETAPSLAALAAATSPSTGVPRTCTPETRTQCTPRAVHLPSVHC